MNSSGFSIDNYHDGNTTINGNLFVDGKVFDAGGGGEIPLVFSTNHIGLDVYAGTNSATGGIVDITDLKQIVKKHGNWRIVSGNVTMSLLINGYSNFTIQFNSPVTGDIINNIYLNGGNSGAIGNTSPNFFASSVTQFGGIIKIRFITADKGLWPQNQSVFTNARYCISYITANSDPANEVLTLSSFVENPMIENLDGGNFNITNVNNIQATTFNGGQILSNPYFNDFNLNGDLNINEFNINQLASIQNLGLDLIINTSNLDIQNTPVNLTGISPLDLNNNDIKCNQIIPSIGNDFKIDAPLGLLTGNFNTLDLTNSSGSGINIPLPTLLYITSPLQIVLQCQTVTCSGSFFVSNDLTMTNTNITNVNSLTVKNITNLIGPVGFQADIDLFNNDIKRVTTLTVSNITSIGDIDITTGVNSSVRIGNQASTTYINDINTNQIIDRTQRRTESTTGSVITTVHIYEILGITESIINEGGFNFYQLLDNTTYIFHGDIILTQGFKYGVNSAIKGTSTASSITFNESKNNIIGFKATNQNLVLQDITIYAGGGHFSNSNVGLIQGSNFDTAGLAPIYGRNKRCLISGCNIVAAFSLGKIQGYGTTNILSNFINGGGSSPTGIYTNFGLDVSDGLSFELRGNKFVLFKGAQATSTTKMINFVNSTISPVILGINAVIISGNILHPRDDENAINFENGAIVTLGTISANTFIRTGGTSPLINYDRASLYDNYNYPSVQNFEIVGNAGVINSQPVLVCILGSTGSMNSAVFTDLSYTITDMNPISSTKRFAYKLVMTGLTGTYTAGKYLKQSVGNNKGLIARADPVILGTQAIYITDADQLSGAAFIETDKDNIASGVSSTNFQLGTNSNNFEFIYLEKDDENVQFVLGVNFDNDSKEDEIQFRLEFDETGTGNSYIGNNVISALQAKDGRTASVTLPFIKRMKFGDLVKLTYRYVDNTNTVVTSVTWSAK